MLIYKSELLSIFILFCILLSIFKASCFWFVFSPCMAFTCLFRLPRHTSALKCWLLMGVSFRLWGQVTDGSIIPKAGVWWETIDRNGSQPSYQASEAKMS